MIDDFFGDALTPPRPSDGFERKPPPARPSYPERGRGRPTIAESRRIQEEKAAKLRLIEAQGRISAGVTDIGEIGLDVKQLADLFRLTKEQVKRRLENCPHHRTLKNNHLLYLVHVAAPFLIAPHDFDRRVRQMNKKDLPPELDMAIRKARAARRKEEIEGGYLVRVEKVQELLGRVLNVFEEGHREQIEKMMRKETIPVDTMEEIESDLLQTMSNIHGLLTKLGEEDRTTSIAEDGFDEEPDDGRDFAHVDYGNELPTDGDDPAEGDDEDE